MMKKWKMLAAVPILVLAMGSSSMAAVKTMPDGGAFDSQYYASANPDVAAAIGTDENTLYEHYKAYGKAEGRSAYNPESVKPEAAATAQPSADDPPISNPAGWEDAMKLLSHYDPDAYWFVSQDTFGDGEIYLSMADSSAAGLDTVVHELFHAYTFSQAKTWRAEAIYTGGSQVIEVEERGNVFPSEYMNIPENLRTFRYGTYVSSGAFTSSNTNGAYGLLNEFSAYCWGMHSQLALYPYYASQNDNTGWFDLVNSCENNFLAFCEFRYWILSYLSTAQAQYPDTYQTLMGNQEFINAYCVMERKFEAEIQEYKTRQPQIVTKVQEKGISSSFTDQTFWIGYEGVGRFTSDQRLLLSQISSAPLKAQEQALFAACTLPVSAEINVTP